MAQITLTIPDQMEARVIDALCNAGRVPVSGANAKQQIIHYIKAVVRRYEAQLSEQNNDITVT